MNPKVDSVRRRLTVKPVVLAHHTPQLKMVGYRPRLDDWWLVTGYKGEMLAFFKAVCDVGLGRATVIRGIT